MPFCSPNCFFATKSRVKMFKCLRIWSISLLSVFLICGDLRADNWTQFRGPKWDGSTQSSPSKWDASENVRWKIELQGEGWSSPVFWGDMLFLTVAVPDEGGKETTRPQPYSGGGGQRRSDLTNVMYRFELICLDRNSGKEVWRKIAKTAKPSLPRHSSNSYATETPITDGKFVYAYFGMTGLFCYDLVGNLQWSKNIGSFKMRAGWGTSSSPILFNQTLFVQVDNEEQSFVVALDAATGKEKWRANRNEPSQYSSPIIWQNSRRKELIVGGQVYRSYDPENGKLLWSLDMSKGRSSATPIAVGERLYVGTEFRNRGGADDGGGFLFCVRPGGKGDITPSGKAASNDAVAWKIEKSGIQMASPVYCRGHICLLERRGGIVNCINAESGVVVYRKRVPTASAFWASPWTDGERVFCLDGDGTTHVLSGGKTFGVISRNKIDEQSWSSPSVSNGMLFLRTIDRLYCIGN